MKKLIAKYKWLQLLFGFILIAVGVLTIITIINTKENYEQTVFFIWALGLFLIAGLILTFDLVGFSDKPVFASLIIAGLCTGVGIFALTNKEIIIEVINKLLTYLLISIGGMLLLKPIILAVRKVSFKTWLLPFILGVIFLSAGIVFYFLEEKTNNFILFLAIAILFVVLGAVEIIGFITLLANKRPPQTTQVSTETRGKGKKGKKKKGEQIDEDIVDVNIDDNQEVVDGTPKEIEMEDDVKLIE